MNRRTPVKRGSLFGALTGVSPDARGTLARAASRWGDAHGQAVRRGALRSAYATIQRPSLAGVGAGTRVSMDATVNTPFSGSATEPVLDLVNVKP